MGIANIINNSTTTSGGEIVRELVNASDGAGLHFDGAVGSIDIASPPDLGTKLSFEFVCKVDDPSGTQNGLLVDFGGGSGRAIFGASSSISGNFGIYYNSAWATFGLNPLTDGSVHHLIASIDGTTATLYDNGNQIATATIGSLNIDGCTDARIGTNFVSTGGFFEGTIYRARFWNKTLSSAEVQTAYERADVDYSSQYGSQTKLIDSDFNGSFDGWNTSNDWATQTNNSNAMQLVANAANQICRTGTQLTKGKRYRVTYTASGVTGSPGFSTAASSHVVAGVITAGTANSFEFTFPTSATSQYFYIKSNASGDAVTLDDISVVQIGAVSDYDLAFANPTQSLTVQDRSGAADGTASASGVTQVQPVVQLNSTSARIGTTAATPADGQVIGDKITTTNAIQLERVSQYTAKLSCVDSGGNQTLQILGNRSAGSGSSGTDVLIGGQQSRTTGNVLKVDQGSDTYLTIDSSGMVTVTNATEAKLRLQNTKDWGGSDSGNIGTLEFYTTDSSGAGARVVGAVQCAQDAASAAPNGELVFKTALGGGSAAAAVERMRITSAGQVNITGPTSYPETSEHPLLVKAGMANGLSNRYIKLQQTYTGSAKDGIPIVWETNADGSNNKSYGYIRTKADGTVAIGNKAAGAAVAVGTALGTTEHLTIDSTGLATFSAGITVSGGILSLSSATAGSLPSLTISSDAITITSSAHQVDVETGSADDLKTINGGALGSVVILRTVGAGETITVKDQATGGNLLLAGDFSMASNHDTITLLKTGTYWQEISRSDNA
jgi:hypothetical protein